MISDVDDSLSVDPQETLKVYRNLCRKQLEIALGAVSAKAFASHCAPPIHILIDDLSFVAVTATDDTPCAYGFLTFDDARRLCRSVEEPDRYVGKISMKRMSTEYFVASFHPEWLSEQGQT